jgi:Protein of unknown function (DUF3106)
MPPRHLSRAKARGLARPHRWAAAWLSAGLVVLGACGMAATSAKAQPGKTTAPATTATTTAAATAAAKPTVAKPLWRELTTRQQKALEPLASYWDEMTEPHKRKWLAISRDYAKLPASDQEVLHSRMTEWATLSNQQRAQARLNFADVKQVPADERKAKWEAYQALSDEEKSKLAARATTAKPPPGAASTIRPVPLQKLAPVPGLGADAQRMPRIQLAPPPATAASATAPVAAARPAPPPSSAPAPTPSFPPVSAEAQVPAPSAPETPVPVSDQPASAP